MVMQVNLVAAGEGWCAIRLVCSAGPFDRPFEERHDRISVSLVARGSFEYRSADGAGTLVPGALLLGNDGVCYRCGHEHSSGDECISFQFDQTLWQDVVAATPGARSTRFERPVHPPDWAMAPLLTEVEAIGGAEPPAAMEELALRLAGAAILRAGELQDVRDRNVARRDQGRIIEAVRRIEMLADDDTGDDLSLGRLAREADMSRFHFLRQFRRVVGMTPHQFVLSLRMRRAAALLRRSSATIAAIAFEAGFGDLSTFNRQFRRIYRMTPAAFRKAGAV